MRCTRSPACVRFFLLARLSSGLGDRCRYPTQALAINTTENPHESPKIVVSRDAAGPTHTNFAYFLLASLVVT